MVRVTRKTGSIELVDTAAIPFDTLIAGNRPVILKALVKDWPLTRAGMQGADAAIAYLERFYNGRPVTAYTGEAGAGPRFFYDDSATAMLAE